MSEEKLKDAFERRLAKRQFREKRTTRTVTLPHEFWTGLKAISKVRGVPMTELLEMVVGSFLDAYMPEAIEQWEERRRAEEKVVKQNYEAGIRPFEVD